MLLSKSYLRKELVTHCLLGLSGARAWNEDLGHLLVEAEKIAVEEVDEAPAASVLYSASYRAEFAIVASEDPPPSKPSTALFRVPAKSPVGVAVSELT